MKKWLKRLKRLGIALLLLVALPLAAVIAINAFDELLDAKAANRAQPACATQTTVVSRCWRWARVPVRMAWPTRKRG